MADRYQDFNRQSRSTAGGAVGEPEMKKSKVIQVNRVKCLVQHDDWMGWTVRHVMDGRHVSGSSRSLAELRRGMHSVTSPGARENLKAALAGHF